MPLDRPGVDDDAKDHAGAHLQPHLAICFKCHLLDEGSKTTSMRTHTHTPEKTMYHALEVMMDWSWCADTLLL